MTAVILTTGSVLVSGPLPEQLVTLPFLKQVDP